MEQVTYPVSALASERRECVPVTTGDRRGGMEWCVDRETEEINVYPSHCGFAAQHLHCIHNHLPSHGVPQYLVHPRDT